MQRGDALALLLSPEGEFIRGIGEQEARYWALALYWVARSQKPGPASCATAPVLPCRPPIGAPACCIYATQWSSVCPPPSLPPAVTEELAKGIDAAWRLTADTAVGTARQQLLSASLDAREL